MPNARWYRKEWHRPFYRINYYLNETHLFFQTKRFTTLTCKSKRLLVTALGFKISLTKCVSSITKIPTECLFKCLVRQFKCVCTDQRNEFNCGSMGNTTKVQTIARLSNTIFQRNWIIRMLNTYCVCILCIECRWSQFIAVERFCCRCHFARHSRC